MTTSRSASAIALAVSLTLLSAAPPATAQSPDHALGEALWISGLTVLVSSWALTGAATSTLVYLAAARDESIVESWIPVVGPWIMLADSAGFDGLQLAGTAISGILQLAGLVSLITGLVLVDQDPSDSSGTTLTLSPLEGGSTLSLFGRF